MVECWPQHIVFANGQKQMSEGSAPRAATKTKRQRGTVSECVHMCAHTCKCMYPCLFQQPGCMSEIPYSYALTTWSLDCEHHR